MKIAFIVGEFPVLSETFILNQITGLISRGHEVHIYGSRPDDMSKMHPDVERYQLLKRTYYVPSIATNYLVRVLKGLGLIVSNLHKSPLVVLRSLNFFKYGKYAISLRLLYSVIPLLPPKQYDIIHGQFGMHGIEGQVFRDIGAIKGRLITSFRGYDISYYVQECGEDVYNELFVKGDFFLANCEFFRQKAINLGCERDKIVVLRSGIDCSRFQFKVRSPNLNDKIRIVTVGRLVEKKGIEYGIRALAKVANVHPNVEYNIIGDGYLKEELHLLIEELRITDKVKLLGWKNQQEIIDILDNSHLFIAPSVTAQDGNQDAPVNTLKEAMAMGLPVIGTLHGGIPELVQDGVSGFLVPERDADAIAEKLIYLIEHPHIWEQMGRMGRTCVEENYDINKLNDKLVNIYQLLATSPPQSNQAELPVVRANRKYINP